MKAISIVLVLPIGYYISMVVGVPKEIKVEEYRVSVTPSGAKELRLAGHEVLVETGAGVGSGFTDSEYSQAGAIMCGKLELYDRSDLIVKVKEPLPSEFEFFKPHQTLFTYLHLAPNRELIDFLIDRRITAFAYETLEDGGGLPLLSPMSEIAGRMSPLMGAYHLQKFKGGMGLLATGAVGVSPARVVIIGAGVVGSNAARIAFGIGMRVTVVNRGIERLRLLDEQYLGEIETRISNSSNIADAVKEADMVIGAVLVPGAKAPVCVTREMIGSMKKGAVLVDVSIDQGGCFETSRPTTHSNPTFEVDGVIHYCVANMPGAYPRTSTISLTNSTLPYIIKLASATLDDLLKSMPFQTALNIYNGNVVNKPLAESAGFEYRQP